MFAGERRSLWEVAEEAAVATGESAEEVFLPIGLRLVAPGSERASGYESTPAQAETFADTGSDGVHFSAVLVAASTVIVMTVPMYFERANHVVGTSLHDFLCLGCRTGYFALEQLAYDPFWTVEWLQAGEPDDPEDQWLLDFLCTRLQLQPWTNVGGRLAQLATLLDE